MNAPEAKTAHEVTQEAKADDVVKRILFWLKLMGAATVLVYIVVGAIGLLALVSAARIHDSLCSFKTDLDNRIEQSQAFLNHPERFPTFKLTPDLRRSIQLQIDNQTKTSDSLDNLHCG